MMTETDVAEWLNEQLDAEDTKMRAALNRGDETIDVIQRIDEIEIKRRIIELYELQAAKQYENAAKEDCTWILESVICIIATLYADQPGYQPEWAPSYE